MHEFGQGGNGDVAAVARRILGDRLQDGFADARFDGVGTHREARRRVGLAAQRLAGPFERRLPPLDGRGDAFQRNALGLALGDLAFEQRDRNARPAARGRAQR